MTPAECLSRPTILAQRAPSPSHNKLNTTNANASQTSSAQAHGVLRSRSLMLKMGEIMDW